MITSFRFRRIRRIKMKNLLSLLLTLLMVVSMWAWDMPVAKAASGTISASGTYDISAYGNSSTITINSGLTVTLTNTGGTPYTNTQIVCGAGVTLTTNSLNISNTTSTSPLSFTGSNNKLIVTGPNVLKSGGNMSAIKVESGTELEISGSGYLTVTGSGGGAGIGGGSTKTCGTVRIIGGQINATGGAGGGLSGAAIGGGDQGSGGTIEISGGHFFIAGGSHAAGIGGGRGGSGGSITISGGVVLGSGGAEGGAGIGGGYNGGSGTILISGGDVTVNGNKGGAGIGGGYSGSAGSISISGGVIHAEKGNLAPHDVGNGQGGSGGTLNLSGSAVLFIKNGNCITPTTSSHTLKTTPVIADSEGLQAYGLYLPEPWGPTAYIYVNENDLRVLTYDYNEGSGTLPAAATQYKGTTTRIADGSSLTYYGHSFIGWNSSPDGSGHGYSKGNTYTFNNNTTLYAQYDSPFSQGNGTEAYPYGITTPQQLNTVRDYPDAHFILLNDIDMSEATSEGGAYWNNGAGWEPIGDNVTPFTGVFDGNGYKIIGLNLDVVVGINTNVGLFGYINSATVTDVGLVDCDIKVSGTGYDPAHVGSIAGYAAGSTISNCFNRGSVSVSGYDIIYCGGIAGFSSGIISGCYNAGSVSGIRAGDIAGLSGIRTGGIAGLLSSGKITNCYNSGNVNGKYVGGIVSYIAGTGSKVTGCFNAGSLSGLDYIGGLAGYVAAGLIEDCYNIDTVQGIGALTYPGGIAGYISSGTVNNSYNIGGVSGGYFGGIAGRFMEGTVSHCYYINNISKGVGTGTDTTIPVAIVQLSIKETFVGFDFDTAWTMEGNTSYPYPELKSLHMINIPVSSIEVTSDVAQVMKSNTLQMSAIVDPEFSADKTVSWSVENGTGAASITQAGLLTGTQIGKVTVKATANDGSGVFGTKQIEIMPLLVSNIAVKSSEDKDTVAKNATLQMSVEVLPSDADEKRVTWSVTNGTGSATIDQSGVLTGISVGKVTVKATARDNSGEFGTKEIEVTSLLVNSITVTCASDTVMIGKTLQIGATVLPEESDNKDITWSVEAGTGEATIDSSGLLTGVSAGTVTVKATAQDGSGISGSKIFTVISLEPPTASSASASYNSINISWDAVEGAAGYEVYRSTSAEEVFTKVYESDSPGILSYTDTNLVTGNTYNYKVRSYSGSPRVYSDYSETVTATPELAAPYVVPYSTTYTSAGVTWTAVPGASGYEVWYATQKFGTYSLKYTANSGAAGSWNRTGLVTDKTYYFKVRAFRTVNGTNVYGADSTIQSTAPGRPSLNVTRESSTSAKVSWVAVSGSAGYEVWRGTQKNGVYSLKYTAKSNITSWTNTGLTTGKAYYYQVRAWRMVNGLKVYGQFSSINSVVP